MAIVPHSFTQLLMSQRLNDRARGEPGDEARKWLHLHSLQLLQLHSLQLPHLHSLQLLQLHSLQLPLHGLLRTSVGRVKTPTGPVPFLLKLKYSQSWQDLMHTLRASLHGGKL